MKLSQFTVMVLKNFSVINQGIIIKPGCTLRTVSRAEHIVATALVDEEFEVGCEIWNLGTFLQVYSVMDEPDVDWGEDYAILTSTNTRLQYAYGQGVGPVPPEGDIDLDFDATFTVTADMLNKITKMGNILGSEKITFSLSGSKPQIVLDGQDMATDNFFYLDIGEKRVDGVSYDCSIGRDNLVVMPGIDYEVSLSETAIKFASDSHNLSYIISTSGDE